jgi:ribose 5-phosphate isomerase B
MIIALGSDHKGIEMKEQVKRILEDMGIAYIDVGTNTPDRVDYPDYAGAASRMVSNGEAERGILICASGIGMSITANKIPGVRAALCGDSYLARMSRLHNNSNVLCLGALVTGPAMAEEIVHTWISTEFEGGRHQDRLEKIKEYEKGTPHNRD